ncbi:hypothetical protein [Lignipirellula cremea]|uniref:Uncharacterized protein n=1 Tax=Lignipirellula cremea TaxID=2528010 RepID=A0A518DNX7_9BACT|nr:hypothetical protein [Lignipirellula cremea]QDU93534.1 hypothetical protein Pla8534_13140 [Lignipirellula cremea]
MKSRRWQSVFTLLLCGGVVWCSDGVGAAEADPPADEEAEVASAEPAGPLADLAADFREAKSKISPVTADRVAAAKSDLQKSMRNLTSYLGRRGSRSLAGWKRYLLWDQLEAELAAETPDLAVLGQVGQKLFADHDGLDRPRFLEFRTALKAYVTLAGHESDPDFVENMGSVYDDVAKMLEQQQAAPTTLNAAEIGNYLGYIEGSENGQSLVSRVRGYYLQPNFYGQFSGKLVRSSMSRFVDNCSPVDDVIVGSRVIGAAHTVGNVKSDLGRARNYAALELRFTGQIHSTTSSPNRSVTVFSKGLTQFQASKPLMLDANGFRAGASSASASVNSTTTGISAPNFIVRHIANKQVAKKKPQAEWESARKAENRLTQNLDRQTAQQISDANRRYRENVRAPLLRREGFPQLLAFATPRDELDVTGLQAHAYQLGSHSRPSGLSRRFDSSLWLHESAIGNYSQVFLGGKTYDNTQMAEMNADAVKDAPVTITQSDGDQAGEGAEKKQKEKVEEEEEEEPWSITFSSVSPLFARFDDGRITIGVEGVRFTRGEDAINDRLRISAEYGVATTSRGELLLTRASDVDVQFVDLDQLGARQIAFKTFLAKKFADTFSQEITISSVKPQRDMGKIARFLWREATPSGQWLGLGLDSSTYVTSPSAGRTVYSYSQR